MLAFLLGCVVLVGGVFTAFFGARTQEVAYLATAKAPSVIEMVGVAAVGAWLGVLIGAGGLLLL